MTSLFSNRSRLAQFCSKLRQVLFYIWGTLFVDIIVNTIGNVTTMTADTPLSKLLIINLVLAAPIPVFACLGFLVLLTIFSWTGSHERGTSSTLSPDQQNRVRMLHRLQRSYEELMLQSLQGVTSLELRLTEQPTAVQNLVTHLSYPPNQIGQPIPPGTSILQVYDAAAHELLILGEPGAGKSTLLLDLAQQLVQRAASNETHPLPVILPLSSWAMKRLPLDNWIVEQLTEFYDIPRHLGERWVQENALLLLLDGLDEMDEGTRPVCIAAINTYLRAHLAVPLVVCSRRTEYEHAALQQRLILQNAVVVQPLTEAQIDAYLIQAGRPLSALRSALKKKTALEKLATTPLMLHILMQTYQGIPVRQLPQREGPLHIQIWDDYVKRMVERKEDRAQYPLERRVSWLSWLAWQMQQHNLTVFHIERMQPDWLPATQAYEKYAVRWPGILIGVLVSLLVNALIFNSFDFVRLIVYGFIGGQIGWLFSRAQIGKQADGLQARLLYSFARPVAISVLIGLGVWLSALITVGQAYSDPNDLLHNGLITGLSTALSSFLLCMFFQRGQNRLNSFSFQPGSISANSTSWRMIGRELVRAGHLVNAVRVGLSVGLTFGLVTELSFTQQDGLLYGMTFGIRDGLTYGLAFGLIGILLSVILMTMNMEIHPTEVLTWSWRSLWRSLLSRRHGEHTLLVGLSIGSGIGLGFGLSTIANHWLSGSSFGFDFGLAIGLGTSLGDGLAYGLTFGIAYWLLLGLFRGLSSEYLDEDRRIKPNEGIRRSIRISMWVGLSSSIVSGLIGVLSMMFYYGLHTGLAQGWNLGLSLGLRAGLSNALNMGLNAGLLVGLQAGLLCGLLACLLMGGLASLRHIVLRLLLQKSNKIPADYTHFLDNASDCILLHKVGGGYEFIHDLLLEHFALLKD